jgi:adenylate kinase family enzyme
MEINKYQKGKIYKITDTSYSKCYIGSTTESLAQRMARHRKIYGLERRQCSAALLFDEFGVENCKIELVEEFPCENREQLRKREGFHIQDTVCVNKNFAGRSRSEYCEANKDQINKNRREYYHANKEALTQRRHDYEVANKEKLTARSLQYCEANRDKIAERRHRYYEQNKEQLAAKRHDYYEANKEAIACRRQEKFMCDVCQGRYSRNDRSKHLNTLKHQDALSIQNIT